MDSALQRLPVLAADRDPASSTTARRASPPTTSSSSGEAPGAAELLRRGRLQLGRHRVRGRGRPGAGPVDHRRPARRRPDHRGHPPVRRRSTGTAAVAAGPGRRGARAALRGALAEPRAGDRPAVPPLARLSPAARGQRLLRLQDGLGAGQLLRPAGAEPRYRVLLGQAELAAVVVAPSSSPPARRWRCSTRPRSPSTWSPGRTPRPRCSGCAPTTWPSRPAGPSTPGCSTTAAPTSPTSP